MLRERFKNFSMSNFIDLLQELPRPLLLAFRSQGLIRNNAVALGVDDSRRVALQVHSQCNSAFFLFLIFVAGVRCVQRHLGAGYF